MKKLIVKNWWIFILALFLAGQDAMSQTNLYVNPDFVKIAKTHKIIAVLPFSATISLRPKQMKSVSVNKLRNMEKDEGYSIQNALQSWFLKRKMQGKTTIDVQEPTITNSLLKKKGITWQNLNNYTPVELGKLLKVDAIISGSLKSTKPMSEGASAALGLLVGFWGATNSGLINISVNDVKSGVLLWKYEKKLSGGLGSDMDNIINALMRKSTRRLAYMKMK